MLLLPLRRGWVITSHKMNVINYPCLNTLRPRQNGRRFADDTSKRIFLNENVWISIKISLKFVPKGPIINIPSFVQIMAWRRSGDKPLSEPMMVSLPTHICVTRPQWVDTSLFRYKEFLLIKCSSVIGRVLIKCHNDQMPRFVSISFMAQCQSNYPCLYNISLFNFYSFRK